MKEMNSYQLLREMFAGYGIACDEGKILAGPTWTALRAREMENLAILAGIPRKPGTPTALQVEREAAKEIAREGKIMKWDAKHWGIRKSVYGVATSVGLLSEARNGDFDMELFRKLVSES